MTFSELNGEIIRASQRFMQYTGIESKRLYVGTSQRAAMEEWIQQNRWVTTPREDITGQPIPTRLQWMGHEVFVVDALDHLDVS